MGSSLLSLQAPTLAIGGDRLQHAGVGLPNGPEALDGSRFGEIEALFDAFEPRLDSIDPAGDGSIIRFERSKTLLDLSHVLSQIVDGGADVAQMFKDEVLRIVGHRLR